jgi:hypothetical protein
MTTSAKKLSDQTSEVTDRQNMRSRAMPVPRFRSRLDRVPSTENFDPSKLTNEQIESEIVELAVKIPDQSYSELREANIGAKQFLLTAELKWRRDGQPKPTIEEIKRELAQVKDKVDEAYSRWEMRGIGDLERKKDRLRYVLKFLQGEPTTMKSRCDTEGKEGNDGE